ncbi:uncharacterized protein EV154DRAFT_485313 [Mucor mucedo]|uniref:uncharacterized protein n=1 Tax=Mucor mucedo TaxID=29922 RepID=UPI00221F526D|nr:uncharacterized protein EV154DRAFT_485313 [Mucor mucedo]KAI7884984.1 hypothetical protein EV154DRAFT_485313 [Mucor mucedo]
MSPATLPYEVLLEIFSYTERKTIVQCSCVCKSWNQPALTSLFQELYLHDGHDIVKQDLDETSKGQKYFKYCGNVKTLKIKERPFDASRTTGEEYMFTRQQFIKLLEYMPNLQTLDLSLSSGDIYLKFILESDSIKCLNHIQTISPAFSKFYFPVCFKYRTSIVNLRIESWTHSTSFGPQAYPTLTVLSHFTALKNLSLRFRQNQFPMLSDLLGAFPNLLALKIGTNSYFRHLYLGDFVPNRLVGNIRPPIDLLFRDGNVDPQDNFIQTSLPQIITPPRNVTLHNATKNTQCITVESLTLGVPETSGKQIIDIATSISNRLQNLYLLIDMELNEWVRIVGMDNALKLMRRMATMNNAIIYFKIYDFQQSRYTRSNMTDHFTMFNAFRGCDTTCAAIYGYRSIINDPLLFEYGLKRCDYYRQNINGTRTIIIALPDVTSSIIGPEIFNSLTIYIAEPDSELTHMFLEYALVNCSKLQSYTFINLCRGPEQIRLQLRRNQNRENDFHDSQDVIERLTVLVIEGCIPPRRTMERINHYLPHIELLCLSGTKYRMSGEITGPIDTTSLKGLKRFYMDLRKAYCWIHMKYTDGTEAYYHFTSRYHSFKEVTVNVFHGNGASRVKDRRRIRKTTILCNKETAIVFFYGEKFVVAEIEKGQLHDYINFNSDYKNLNFLPKMLVPL